MWNVGDKFEQYFIVDRKEGGMGIVLFVAHSLMPSMKYAVKTFKDEYFYEENVIKRFWREAEEWIKLGKHKNIVFADHIFEVEGKPYLYLEWIEGNSLRYWIRNGLLDIPLTLDFPAQFCAGMEFAYQDRKIVHRDVKPENVLIRKDKVLKITDFGLAKIFDGSKQKRVPNAQGVHTGNIFMSQKGIIMGTVPYMSPEQFDDPATVGRSSDIYSFGIMLFEMLTGELPFEAATIVEFQVKHHREKPVKPSSINPSVPKALDAIVLKALEKRPEQRYGSFEEMSKAIINTSRRYRGGNSILGEIPGEVYALNSEELTQKGFGLLHLKRDEEAIEYFDKAIEMSPKDFEASAYKGYCLGNLGRHKEAIESCLKAVEINPGFAHAWGNLGYSYSALGNHNKAIECYERAIKLNPNDITHYNNKAIALIDAGRFEEAFEIAEQGLKIDPRYYRLWSNRGTVLMHMNKHYDAVKSYLTCIKINPRAHGAWQGLYLCYKALNMPEEAERCLERARQIDPSFTT